VSAETVVTAHAGIADIGREAWEACANPLSRPYNPFLSYDFLQALEESGSAAPRAGWGPRHLTVRDAGGAVIGAMPLYLKSHSNGEYVFDWAWADAYERAGGRYYPKLLSAVPFTPVTAPKFLLRDGAPGETRRPLLAGALSLCEQAGASSLHLNFPVEEEWTWLGREGLLQRQDQQYHWLNRGYRGFEDFLADLSANRRKTIRRERRDAQAGLGIRALTGGELTEGVWDAFFAFYMDTGGRKWGRPYLNRRFFSLLGERLADRVLLILAEADGRPIAGALNLIGGDCLYGRYWGALEERPFLHFELCYYQAIEHAIRLGLPRVEAGAQGQHKIARGYLPTPVYSAHWIADPALRGPVARYLDEERRAVATEMRWLEAEYSPFKAG
jgi:uncharacterized protein